MPDVKLTSFVEAESKLDGTEAMYIAQNGKTRKTFLSKVKTFILEDILKVVGDVDVENDGDIAAQLNAMANNKANKENAEFKGNMILNDENIATYSEIELELWNGWTKTSESAICKASKSGNIKSLNMCIYNGSKTAGTIITFIGRKYAPKKTLAFPIVGGSNNIIAWLNIQSDGNVVVGGGNWENFGSSWININCCFA